MPSGSEGEGEEDEEQEGGSGSGSGSDDDEEGGGGRQGGFLEGGKAASFAKAFAKILDTSGKKAAEAAEAVGAAPILAVSKSIAKRKAEVEAETKADREAKKLRQEMKQRGHVVRACRLVQAAAARLGSCGCMAGELLLQGWEAAAAWLGGA